MKKLAGFIGFCLVCGALFDRAKPKTKAKIVGGIALTTLGLWKAVQAANKPNPDAAYWGIDDDPRYW